jgi:hypothetical protein
MLLLLLQVGLLLKIYSYCECCCCCCRWGCCCWWRRERIHRWRYSVTSTCSPPSTTPQTQTRARHTERSTLERWPYKTIINIIVSAVLLIKSSLLRITDCWKVDYFHIILFNCHKRKNCVFFTIDLKLFCHRQIFHPDRLMKSLLNNLWLSTNDVFPHLSWP